MADITATPFGAAEHCALDNWAAEYAKKLFVNEAAERTADIAAEEAARKGAITAEEQARAAAIEAEQQARAAAIADVRQTCLQAVASEQVNRSQAITSVRNDFTAADTKITNAYIAADKQLKSDIAADYRAADAAVSESVTSDYKAAISSSESKLTSAYTAADKALSSQITSYYTAADTALKNVITADYTAADANAVQQAYNQVTDDYAEILSLNDHAEMQGKEIFISYNLSDTADTDFGIRLIGNLNAISVEADALRVYNPTGREDWEDISYERIGDWDNAAAKVHTHSNKNVLDGITATKVNAWNNPQTATTDRYGTVKLSAKGGISYADGLTVNTNTEYGTGRTGDGKVIIKAATEEEIKAGTQEYKPIVPATFKKALEVNGCITDDNFNSKNPTKGYNSLDDLAIDTADAFETVQTLTRYDETPQEIGTWINGTPVWRQAFNHTFTEQDIKDIETDKSIYIGNIMNVKDALLTYIINASVVLAQDTEYPCIIDDRILTMEQGGSASVEKSMWSSNPGAYNPGIYGYIEFVTAADNIKQ